MKNTLIYKHKTKFGTVKLKSRKNGMNPESLYLEVYLKETQKRCLQFLGMYLTGNPNIDAKTKQEAINKSINYVYTDSKPKEITFTSFCEEQILKIDKPQSRKSPYSAIHKLHKYAGCNTITMTQVNERFLLGFREWLLNKAISETDRQILDKGTSDIYLAIVMRYANRAQRKGLIPSSSYIASEIPAIGKVVKVPVTLTEDEIMRLQHTAYPPTPEICKALMLQFACGQRWGDVRDMNWEQILWNGSEYRIVLKQEKTDKILPSFITKSLIDWIGEGKERKGNLFTGIPKDDQTVREHLQKWCSLAGISKKVGTHTMRRSCATILYKKEVPLFTISKILGHSSTDITLRYIGIDENDIRKGMGALLEITNSFSYAKAS